MYEVFLKEGQLFNLLISIETISSILPVFFYTFIIVVPVTIPLPVMACYYYYCPIVCYFKYLRAICEHIVFFKRCSMLLYS